VLARVALVADAIFEHPRLAAIYDALDPDRSDLEAYVDIADELNADSVVDVGCGTGTFALLLAGRGLEVTGVDPAAGSLAVARAKPGAERVRWVHGDATSLPPLQVDLATMTANVAQAIVDPLDREATLRSLYAVLPPGGTSSSRRATRHTRPGSSGTVRPPTAARRSARWAGWRAGSR